MGSEIKVFKYKVVDTQADQPGYVPGWSDVEIVADSQEQADAWSRFYLQEMEEDHFHNTGHRPYYILGDLIEVK